MSKTGGLDISMEDDNLEFVTPSGGVKEVDVSASGGEIIDPKTVASAAAAAAEDNHHLNIEKDKDDEEEVEEVEEVTPPAAKTTKTIKDDDESPETFKVLGKHFSEEGLLIGYSEEMENTPEALQDMVQQTVQKGIEDYKSSFKHPMAKQFLDYLENGGDPSRFVNVVSGPDYVGIEKEDIEGNANIQKQLLRDHLTASGESSEEVEDMIQAFEDAGQLEKRSLAALTKLQAGQTERQKKEVEAQKETRRLREEQNNKILTDLKTNIDSAEEIGGFALSKKEKTEFYDYITRVDKASGKTPLMTDSSDPKNQLLMSYLYFKKFNFDKLEKKAKTETTKKLEEQLGRFTDTSARQKSRTQTKVAKNEPGQLNLGPLKKAFSA